MGRSAVRAAHRVALYFTFLVVIVSVTCMSSLAQRSPVAAPHGPVHPKLDKRLPWDKPSTRQSASGGLWMIGANKRASLHLKNGLKTDPLVVTPVLYLSNGTRYPLNPVTLEPSGTAVVDLNDGLARQGLAPYADVYGYAEIEYQWPWAAVNATIRNVDSVHSTIFIYDLQAPPDQGTGGAKTSAANLEGAWWKQEKNVSAFIGLGNVTDRLINATIQVTDNVDVAIETQKISIAPHSSKMLDLDQLQASAAQAGGIYVTHDGPNRGLTVNGGLIDPAVGYSAHLWFLSSGPHGPTDHSQAVAGTGFAEIGLMSGVADPMMNFPAGTIFRPYSVVRNLSDQPASVTPTVWWMSGGAAKSAQLSEVTIPAHRTVNLNAPALAGAAGLNDFNGSFNLELSTTAPSGTLLPVGGSVDQTNTYVFEVVPRGIGESASKSLCYWSTGNGDDTMITLWNPADEDQSFNLTLFYSGGQYVYPIQLGARATRMFNMSEILHSSIPDADGNIIPAGIAEGSAEIAGSLGEQEHILVSMDGGVYNVRKAICGVTCISCNGVTGENIVTTPFAVVVAGNKQQTFYMTWNTGGQFSLNSHSTWSSNNTPVATVSTGLIHGVGSGSATISAFDADSEPEYIPSYCTPAPVCPINQRISAQGGGSVTVANAQITSVVLAPTTINLAGSPDSSEITVQIFHDNTSTLSNPTVTAQVATSSTNPVGITVTYGSTPQTVSLSGASPALAHFTVASGSGVGAVVIQASLTAPSAGINVLTPSPITDARATLTVH